MDKKTQINFWYVIIAVFGILLIQNLYSQYTKVEPIPYSRFHTLLDQDKIAEIAITENHIYGTLKERRRRWVEEFRYHPGGTRVGRKAGCAQRYLYAG